MERLGSGASAEISQPAQSAVATAAVDQASDIHEIGAHSHPTAMAVARRHESRLLSGLMFLIHPNLSLNKHLGAWLEQILGRAARARGSRRTRRAMPVDAGSEVANGVF